MISEPDRQQAKSWPSGASNGRDSSSSAAEPAVVRLPKAEGSCDGTYSLVLRLLSEPGEQRVPAVAN